MNPLINPIPPLFDIQKVQQGIQKVKGILQQYPRRAQNVFQSWHNSLFGSGKGTLAGQKTVDGPGTDVVSLDKDVIVVTPETEQRGTLFNEFVERWNPTIHPAQWYRQHQDGRVSDRRIPVSNFSYYAGVEDGAFKVMPLERFQDNTVIVPARNLTKGAQPIQEIISQQDQPTEEDKKKAKQLRKEVMDLYKYQRPQPRVTGKWYHSGSMVTGGDPYIVPNTGERLSDDEMHNISRRLQAQNLTQFLWDSPSARQHTDSAFWYADDNKALQEFLDRQEQYVVDTKKQFDAMPDSLEEWVKPLTPEEERIMSLWMQGQAEPSYEQKAYGDKIFKPKLVDVPRNVAGLLNWYTATSGMPVSPIHNFEKRFLQVYDKEYLNDVTKAHESSIKQMELLKQIKALEGKEVPIRVVTTNNDTIPISKYNASVLDKKMILGNPEGGLFIADFGNLSYDQLMNQVNPYLKKHPSVLFMPDMGAYSLYGLQNGVDPDMLKHTYMDVTQKPTYSNYWNQFTEDESRAPYDPSVHYLVGVKRKGGKINYLTMFQNGRK